MGSNLWIVPKEPVLPANPSDPQNNMTIVNPVYLENQFINLYFISRYFDINAYTQGNSTNPYKVKYDYRNYLF